MSKFFKMSEAREMVDNLVDIWFKKLETSTMKGKKIIDDADMTFVLASLAGILLSHPVNNGAFRVAPRIWWDKNCRGMAKVIDDILFDIERNARKVGITKDNWWKDKDEQ